MSSEGLDGAQSAPGKLSNILQRRLKKQNGAEKGMKKVSGLQNLAETGKGKNPSIIYLLGLLSSPTTARKPPNENSSGWVGFSFASTPTSTLTEAWLLSIRSCQSRVGRGECQKALRTRDCDIVS